MTYNPLNIALGMVLLYGVSYGLVLIYSFIYLRFLMKNKEVKFSNMSLSAALVAGAWMASTFVVIWFASNLNLALFALISLVLFFAITYNFSGKLFKVNGWHKFLFSFFLAVLLNPYWLTLTKII